MKYLITFLVVQFLDGLFTYIGITRYGRETEYNKLILLITNIVGIGWGLVAAKAITGLLGAWLYIRELYWALIVLIGFYVTIALIPWIIIFLT